MILLLIYRRSLKYLKKINKTIELPQIWEFNTKHEEYSVKRSTGTYKVLFDPFDAMGANEELYKRCQGSKLERYRVFTEICTQIINDDLGPRITEYLLPSRKITAESRTKKYQNLTTLLKKKQNLNQKLT